MTNPCWPDILDCTERGPKPTLANAVSVLQHEPTLGPDYLWYDEHLDRVMIANSTPRPYRDEDDARITVMMQDKDGIHMPIAESVVASAVRYVARQRVKHCIRDHLPAWDDEPRIDAALETYWGVECDETQPQPYVRAVSRNLFLCIAARILFPGCQVDNMVVLEGAQGVGKSRSLRILGGPYYLLATESFDSKDFLQSLHGALIVEIGELDAMSRARVERAKSIISSPVDKFRGAYERHVRTHPRRCIFVGTTNRNDYGHDETGMRRIWPVRVGDLLDLEALATDRDQLLAEGISRVQAGQSWWTTPPEETLAIQADRQYEDAWTATVLQWCALKEDATSAEILIGALSFREADIGRPEQNRIGTIMKNANWTRKTVRRPGIEKPIKAWVHP